MRVEVRPTVRGDRFRWFVWKSGRFLADGVADTEAEASRQAEAARRVYEHRQARYTLPWLEQPTDDPDAHRSPGTLEWFISEAPSPGPKTSDEGKSE